jgi:hypothetical protein
MTATDRRDKLRAAVARALAERCPAEDYGYDVGPSLVPGPQGFTAGYMVIISCRSPVLVPPRMAHAQLIPDAWPDDATLSAAVGMCLDELAAARKKLLEVPASAGNGHGAGLVSG